MSQKSFFWNGSTVGDADTWTVGGGYHGGNADYQSSLIDILFRALWNGNENRGVLPGWLGELQVSGFGSPLDIATGAAVVYGLFYENTTATTIAVPTPAGETRIDRIVIRRDWAAQTARVYRIPGVEGSTAPPALVQSPNTFYDIPLAQASIDTGGSITVIDEREYCAFSTAPVPGTLTAGHVVNNAVTQAARSTRTCKFFVSAMDMEPPLVGGLNVPWFNTAAWDGSAHLISATQKASEDNTLPPGQLMAYYAGANNQWLCSTFRLPSNMAGTSLAVYLWWVPYVNTSVSYYWRSTFQAWTPNGPIQYGGDRSSTYASGTYVLNQFYRTQLKSVTGLTGTEMVYYLVDWYNPSSGTDRPKVAGLEIQYTGYTP